jgi:hypothetical protein
MAILMRVQEKDLMVVLVAQAQDTISQFHHKALEV